MKNIVITSGQFSLLHLETRTDVKKGVPTILPVDGWVSNKISQEVLKVLAAGVPEEANNEDLYRFFIESDKDVDLAVASYLATFETPKKRGRPSTKSVDSEGTEG